jgi:hypothetical protein
MAIAAAKHRHQPRQQSQSPEVQSQLPQRRSHDCSNKDQVVTALLPGKPAKTVDLTQADPMMRVGRNFFGIRAPTQREQHRTAVLSRRRIGHCERQAAAAADDADWTSAMRGGPGTLIVRSVHQPSNLGVATRKAERTVTLLANEGDDLRDRRIIAELRLGRLDPAGQDAITEKQRFICGTNRSNCLG